MIEKVYFLYVTGPESTALCQVITNIPGPDKVMFWNPHDHKWATSGAFTSLAEMFAHKQMIPINRDRAQRLFPEAFGITDLASWEASLDGSAGGVTASFPSVTAWEEWIDGGGSVFPDGLRMDSADWHAALKKAKGAWAADRAEDTP